MQVATRFGDVEIEEKSCLVLEDGLVGIPHARRFCLISHREESPFLWLQCLDEPAISLAVINPMEFCPGYSFDLQDADAERLGLESPEDAVILTTVSVDRASRRVTTNLLGPVIINRQSMTGRQVVLSSENYPAKHVLFELGSAGENGPHEAAEADAPEQARAA